MGFKTRKGDAPSTGRVRPSANFERTMALASQMAAESVPDEHTVSANEQAPAVVERGVLAGGAGTPAVAVEVPDDATTEMSVEPEAHTRTRPLSGTERDAPPSPQRAGGESDARLARLAIAAIRPSPFQPKGRPSREAVTAVGAAAARAGGIAGLVSAEGHTVFQTLSAEAKRLAELAFSIARDGVREPIEVRTAEDGDTEALSGHRRLAAAVLAGMTEVPVLHRGTMAAVHAAATVLSGNLHREDFTPWQEAVLVTEVIAQRRADGLPADVRTVGAIMGYSHGRVSTLQTIRRVLSPEFLTRLGDVAAVEDALARLANYSRLEEIARMGDDARRTEVLRRLLALDGPTGRPIAPEEPKPVFRHRPKRGGGFTIEVEQPVEALTLGDAAVLRELFATQLARLDARLQALGRGPAS